MQIHLSVFLLFVLPRESGFIDSGSGIITNPLVIFFTPIEKGFSGNCLTVSDKCYGVFFCIQTYIQQLFCRAIFTLLYFLQNIFLSFAFISFLYGIYYEYRGAASRSVPRLITEK